MAHPPGGKKDKDWSARRRLDEPNWPPSPNHSSSPSASLPSQTHHQKAAKRKAILLEITFTPDKLTDLAGFESKDGDDTRAVPHSPLEPDPLPPTCLSPETAGAKKLGRLSYRPSSLLNVSRMGEQAKECIVKKTNRG